MQTSLLELIVANPSNIQLIRKFEKALIDNQILYSKLDDNRETVPDYNKGESILHYAAKFGCHEVLQAAIAEGYSTNEQDKYGQAPLHYVAAIDRDDMGSSAILSQSGFKTDLDKSLEVLLENGADLALADKSSRPPMFVAVNNRVDKSIIKKLAKAMQKNNIDFNMLDEHGYSLAHIATKAKNYEALSILLDHGLSIDAAKDGQTALHQAAMEGDFAAAVELMNMGADPLIKDANNNTVIHTNIIGNQKTDKLNHNSNLVKLFVRKGVDINAVNNAGDTALLSYFKHATTRSPSCPIKDYFEALVSAGADLSVENNGENFVVIFMNSSRITRTKKLGEEVFQFCPQNVKDDQKYIDPLLQSEPLDLIKLLFMLDNGFSIRKDENTIAKISTACKQLEFHSLKYAYSLERLGLFTFTPQYVGYMFARYRGQSVKHGQEIGVLVEMIRKYGIDLDATYIVNGKEETIDVEKDFLSRSRFKEIYHVLLPNYVEQNPLFRRDKNYLSILLESYDGMDTLLRAARNNPQSMQQYEDHVQFIIDELHALGFTNTTEFEKHAKFNQGIVSYGNAKRELELILERGPEPFASPVGEILRAENARNAIPGQGNEALGDEYAGKASLVDLYRRKFEFNFANSEVIRNHFDKFEDEHVAIVELEKDIKSQLLDKLAADDKDLYGKFIEEHKQDIIDNKPEAVYAFRELIYNNYESQTATALRAYDGNTPEVYKYMLQKIIESNPEKYQKFIEKNKEKIVNHDSAIMYEFYRLMSDDNSPEVNIFKAYDRDNPNNKSYRSMFSEPANNDLIYSIREAHEGQLGAKGGSWIIRKMAASYFLVAREEDGINRFVAQIAECERAHSAKNRKDQPSCFPGHITRLGLIPTSKDYKLEVTIADKLHEAVRFIAVASFAKWMQLDMSKEDRVKIYEALTALNLPINRVVRESILKDVYTGKLTLPSGQTYGKEHLELRKQFIEAYFGKDKDTYVTNVLNYLLEHDPDLKLTNEDLLVAPSIIEEAVIQICHNGALESFTAEFYKAMGIDSDHDPNEDFEFAQAQPVVFAPGMMTAKQKARQEVASILEDVIPNEDLRFEVVATYLAWLVEQGKSPSEALSKDSIVWFDNMAEHMSEEIKKTGDAHLSGPLDETDTQFVKQAVEKAAGRASPAADR